MKKLLILFSLAVSILPTALKAQDIQWTLVHDKDQLKVYKGTLPGSPLVAFRGVKTMPVSLAKVSYVMFTPDMELRKKWVESLDKTDNLEQLSQTTAVIYNAFKAPWPIAPRDFVSQAQLTLDPSQKTITLKLKSTEHPKAPPTVGVRAEIIHSQYVLKSLAPQETEVALEALVDFKGKLPHWLVNLVQSRGPEKTLSKLEKVSADPKSPELDWVLTAFPKA